MATLFEHIGFFIHNEEEVYRLADFVLNAGQMFVVENGFYARWTDASGSEIWSRTALDHESGQATFLNIDPHFHGDTVWNLVVGRKLDGEQDDALDAKYLLHTEDETQFITARLQGEQAIRELEEGKTYPFQIALMPHIVRFYEHEDAYRAATGDELTVLGTAFPRGMYSRLVVSEESVMEEILVTQLVGRIISADQRTIERSGDKISSFTHLVVETQFGPVDVPVANSVLQDAVLESGGIVSVVGTFSAVMMGKEQEV
ncbi:MAG: hypothetical protein IJC88_00100 [Oscillospiraceae bacterium]|nr:hypothetical protein [Oscillospiraceae bacterium]